MTQQEAFREIITFANGIRDLAKKHFGDSDVFNYGRLYEYLMAARLGHTVSATFSGQDGFDDQGRGMEYKTTTHKGFNKKTGALKSHTFNYFGFSRKDTYEEQVEYASEKILGSHKHYWGLRSPEAFDLETIYEIRSEDVLDAFLKKLPRVWKNRNAKDPRINIGISTNNIRKMKEVYAAN